MMEAIEFLANVSAYSILFDLIVEGIVTIFVIVVFIWLFLTSF